MYCSKNIPTPQAIIVHSTLSWTDLLCSWRPLSPGWLVPTGVVFKCSTGALRLHKLGKARTELLALSHCSLLRNVDWKCKYQQLYFNTKLIVTPQLMILVLLLMATLITQCQCVVGMSHTLLTSMNICCHKFKTLPLKPYIFYVIVEVKIYNYNSSVNHDIISLP